MGWRDDYARTIVEPYILRLSRPGYTHESEGSLLVLFLVLERLQNRIPPIESTFVAKLVRTEVLIKIANLLLSGFLELLARFTFTYIKSTRKKTSL